MANIYGTDGDDVLAGTGGIDLIHGEKGNDVITSGTGSGTYYGDDGHDWIINRGTATSTLYGGKGNDYLQAAPGVRNVLSGGYGDDIMVGNTGNDEFTLERNTAYDVALGEDTNHDIIVLGGGADVVYGFNYLEHRLDLGGKLFTSFELSGSNTRLFYTGGSVVLYDLKAATLADWNSLLTTMATSSASTTLTTAYKNVLRAGATSAADNAAIKTLVDGIANKKITLGSALQAIETLAYDTTSVASTTYQFFTGSTPSLGGLDYLVDKNGANPNNLNSAYYQMFNIENRYVNFSINLGKYGAGAQAFQTKYGGMTLFEATKAAYKEVFGWEISNQKADAILYSDIGGGMDRAHYFAAYSKDGVEGLGTKAAMVGWLLVEAVKADVGMYARANSNYIHDLMDGANGQVNLVSTYGAEEYAPWWGV